MKLKTVKGESSDKCETEFPSLAMPSHLLSYSKTVKGERSDKRETEFPGLAMPSRFLSYSKIM